MRDRYMAFLRKIFYISFLVVTQITFSQSKIDTLGLKFEKFQYILNSYSNDTTKFSRTKFFKSGLKEKIIFLDNKPSDISIYYHENKPQEIDPSPKLIFWKLIMENDTLEIRHFYNRKGYSDSTKITHRKNKIEQEIFKTSKTFNLLGKIKTLKTWQDTSVYHYNIFGRLKKIEFYSEGTPFKTKFYKNGVLQKIESKNPLKAIDSIQYDNQKNPIRIDRKVEYIIFEYDQDGNLLEKKIYFKNVSGKDYLKEKIIYEYSEGRLKYIKHFNRKDKLESTDLLTYKNAT